MSTGIITGVPGAGTPPIPKRSWTLLSVVLPWFFTETRKGMTPAPPPTGVIKGALKKPKVKVDDDDGDRRRPVAVAAVAAAGAAATGSGAATTLGVHHRVVDPTTAAAAHSGGATGWDVDDEEWS